MEVYINNLPPKISEEKIRSTFSAYGNITKVKLPSYSFCRYGYIHFDDKVSAIDFISDINNTHLEEDGKKYVLYVAFALRKERLKVENIDKKEDKDNQRSHHGRHGRSVRSRSPSKYVNSVRNGKDYKNRIYASDKNNSQQNRSRKWSRSRSKRRSRSRRSRSRSRSRSRNGTRSKINRGNQSASPSQSRRGTKRSGSSPRSSRRTTSVRRSRSRSPRVRTGSARDTEDTKKTSLPSSPYPAPSRDKRIAEVNKEGIQNDWDDDRLAKDIKYVKKMRLSGQPLPAAYSK